LVAVERACFGLSRFVRAFFVKKTRRHEAIRRTACAFFASSLAIWTLVGSGLAVNGGCRAITRYGESRQSIAARRLSRQGHEAMHAGQWDVAEGLFSSALELTATDDRAHWGLAESLWQRGERQAALKHMEEAVRLSASDPRLMCRLGKMYLELDRVAEADRQSLAALQADRQAADIWALRGDCLMKQGDHAGALAAFHQALALQPDYPEAQLQIAELYRMEARYDRLLATIDRLQDTIHSDGAYPSRAHLLRGIALHQLQRHGEAQRCFLDAIRTDPTRAEPHLHLAALLLELGDAPAARESLQTAIALAPQSSETIAMADRIRSSGDQAGEAPWPSVADRSAFGSGLAVPASAGFQMPRATGLAPQGPSPSVLR
jgi:tetratricopeptide (TPR) repeat protein